MKKFALIIALSCSTAGFSQMTMAGDAVQSGGCSTYRLTQDAANNRGAIWSPDSINLNYDFDMTFEVWLGDGNAWGADGLAFVLQENPDGLGDVGHSLAYEPHPTTNPNPLSAEKLAIEIDTWDNVAEIPSDTNFQHMGISTGDVLDHDLYPPTVFPGNAVVDNNSWYEFRVQWVAGSNGLGVYWDGNAVPIMGMFYDLKANVFGGDSIVYWGFTASTGGLSNETRVRVVSNLSITSDQTTVCPGVPINFNETSSSPIGIINSYEWDFGDGSPIDNTPDATHSWTNPGNYTAELTMTDGFGCEYVETISITILDSLNLTMDSTMVSCYGGSDGSAEVVSATGTGPHTYLWNDPGTQTTATASGLAAGTYGVTVTDDLGCVGEETVIITEPAPMNLALDSTMVDCFGESTGSATVTATNGSAPYSYLWDDANAQFAATASNLPAGTYNVTVTDNNSCSLSTSVVITENSDIVSSATSTDDEGGGTGDIDVTVSGGTSPYSFDWSNGESTEDIDGLVGGVYSVIITDDLGCMDTVEVTILQAFELELPTAMSPNGDNLNDTYFINGLVGYPVNTLIITNRWGNVVYKTEDYDNTWNGVNMKGEDLPEGTYYALFETEDGEKHNSFFELRRN